MSEGLPGAESYEGLVTRIRPERTGVSRDSVARPAPPPDVSTASAVVDAADCVKASGGRCPGRPLSPVCHLAKGYAGATVAVRGTPPLLFALLTEVAARGS